MRYDKSLNHNSKETARVLFARDMNCVLGSVVNERMNVPSTNTVTGGMVLAETTSQSVEASCLVFKLVSSLVINDCDSHR